MPCTNSFNTSSIRLGNLIDAWYFGALGSPIKAYQAKKMRFEAVHGSIAAHLLAAGRGAVTLADRSRSATLLNASRPRRCEDAASAACSGRKADDPARFEWPIYHYEYVRLAMPEMHDDLREQLNSWARRSHHGGVGDGASASTSKLDMPFESSRHCLVHYRLGDFLHLGQAIHPRALAVAIGRFNPPPTLVEVLDGGSTFTSFRGAGFAITALHEADVSEAEHVRTALRKELRRRVPNATVIFAPSRSADLDFLRLTLAPMLATGGGSFAIAAAVASDSPQVATPACENTNFCGAAQRQPETLRPGWTTYEYSMWPARSRRVYRDQQQPHQHRLGAASPSPDIAKPVPVRTRSCAALTNLRERPTPSSCPKLSTRGAAECLRSRVNDVACEWRVDDPTYGSGCTKGATLLDCPATPASSVREAAVRVASAPSVVSTLPSALPSALSAPSASTTRRRLLTVHLVTPQVADEYRRNLGAYERMHYRQQTNASVLVATPADGLDRIGIEQVPATLGLTPMSAAAGASQGGSAGVSGRPHGEAARFAIPGGSANVELYVLPTRIALPSAMPSAFAARRPNATCNRVQFPFEYALYSGAFFSYHLLRVPLLAMYDYYLKLDTDLSFDARMPDVGGLLDAASPAFQIAHTAIHSGDRDCQRGILSAVARFERASGTPSASGWCHVAAHVPGGASLDSLDHFMYGNAMAFNVTFMTSPTVLALTEHLYEREWRGYFSTRWTDQAAYMAIACQTLNVSRNLRGSPQVLDLSWLRTETHLKVALGPRRTQPGVFRHRLSSARLRMHEPEKMTSRGGESGS